MSYAGVRKACAIGGKPGSSGTAGMRPPEAPPQQEIRSGPRLPDRCACGTFRASRKVSTGHVRWLPLPRLTALVPAP